ncbi:MAG: hypothetical protein ACE5J5_07845 [Candidatus Hydrothermarchaeales archaeon]
MPTLRDVGLVFFLGGLLILLGYGAVKMLAASETPGLIKLGFFAVLIGVVILIITLIQEQYTEDDESVDRKH